MLKSVIDNATSAAKTIVAAFQNPAALPQPLSQLFVRRNDRAPCRNWTWRNQLIVAVNGFTDARGFRQWEKVGRQVRKGEKAYYILSPRIKTLPDEETEGERAVVCGFKATAVFGLEQTDGEPLPPAAASDDWIRSLPLFEVAKSWGLSVTTFDGVEYGALGAYRHGTGIALGTENLSTWAHELIHAADHRNGNLKELGQHWRSETVAELGGAVLLRLLGHEQDADLGGCWHYIKGYAKVAEIEVVEACGLVLDRTCEAVALILDTAEQLVRPCSETGF